MKPKRKSLAAAMLAALAATGHSATFACDSCDGPCKKCKPATLCNDRGLLDIFDKVAGHVHASLKPKPHASKAGKDSNCDDPGCGCGCAAEANSTGSYLFPEAVPAPIPYSTEPPTAPVPDIFVDPFKDDTASRLRKVPVRSIEYHQPQTQHRESYDPQAFNNYRVILSDEGGTPLQGMESTDEFLTGKSSRRRVTSGAQANAVSGAVVTASTTAPPATIRAGHTQHLPSRPASTAGHANPLRIKD